ncbi:MAG: hypothetical protein R6X02_19080 [Enhygromyxa sp.]
MLIPSPAVAASPPTQARAEDQQGQAEDPSELPASEADTNSEPDPEPAPVEPAPAPPDIEPELPSWDASIPSYEQVPEPEPEPKPLRSPQLEPEIPPDGTGSTVVGAMLLGGGVILTASSGALIFFDNDEVGVWIAGAVIGNLAIAAGMSVLIAGTVKRNRYEPWRLQHAAPPRGTGMLAGGSLALSAGAFGMLMGGISLTLEDADDLPYGAVLLSLGAASVGTGVALLVVGAKRRRAFKAWDQARVTPSFGVIPNPQMRPAGATFGFAGRF